MKLLVGWELGGPSFTARDVDGKARLGEPIWGPSQLLRDLHLRLGLPVIDAPASVRVPQWASRITELADAKAFYAKSFAGDPLGTARTLLAWRDALVDAGWDGKVVPNGGERLNATAAIEAHGDEPLPPGTADRLVTIERELRASTHRVYDSIELVEARTLWSRRWQNVFAFLEQRGTRILQANFALPGAPASTDLGMLQGLLRGEAASKKAVRGDGTLLVFRGETPAEVAALTAGHLAVQREGSLVVRSLDDASLEAAIVRQGLPGQGHTGSSGARPAMQILPLALELAYEPRDPYRVLELLTLPVGPFRGIVGPQLARAVSRQPGIGGQEWKRQREKIRERLIAKTTEREIEAGASPEDAAAKAEAYATSRLERVTEWLETPGAHDRASRAALLALASRVRTLLQKRLASDDASEAYGAAFAQARAFTEALTHESRESFTREDARHLLNTVVRGAEGQDLSIERAHRIPHVAHPGAVLAPTRMVVFWGFVSAIAKKPVLLPWNRAERDALEAAGVVFADPGALLRAEAEAWRRGVLAAQERVVLVIPGSVKGAAMSPHPLWDEIAARLELDETATARITRQARRLLEANDASLAKVAELSPIALPESRAEWTVKPKLLVRNDGDDRGANATALEKLASCPLAWVLEHRAGLGSGAMAKIADSVLLAGNLSHRLVEELHKEGAFEAEEEAFAERAARALERLIETEGATLLLPGVAFERTQLVRQIQVAMRELHRYLDTSGYRIAGVEEKVTVESSLGKLSGRLDVRLVDDKGQEAILDLKWGASRYRELLKQGLAVQLALYARAVRGPKRGALPPAGYFAIAAGRVVTADERMNAAQTLEGDGLDATWDRLERTAGAVMKSLDRGKVFVTSAKRSLPLALGIPEKDEDKHFVPEHDAPCTYCAYPDICGRSWENFQ